MYPQLVCGGEIPAPMKLRKASVKIALGMPIDTDLEIVPVELDLNVPSDDSARAIELATQYRLDLQTARDQIEDARRRVSNSSPGVRATMFRSSPSTEGIRRR